jgi:rhomboid protease GluP
MSLPPELRRFLERLGVNTVRLQWRIRHWQNWFARRRRNGLMPSSFGWVRYRHKFCPQCGALNDRDAKRCSKCGRRLPSFNVYRVFRLLGLIVPSGIPKVSMTFMAAIIVLFGLSILMQGPSAILQPTSRTLLILGAWTPSAFLNEHAYWRFLSCGLFHIGIIHILFNLFALSQIGPVLEDQIGKARLLVVITFTQLTAGLGTLLWYVGFLHAYGMSTAGASGWVFGLIGFGIVYFRRTEAGWGTASGSVLLHWAIYALVFGLLVGANNAAHVGGLLGGLLLGLAPSPHMRRPQWTRFWNVTASICTMLWLIALAFLAHSIITNWAAGGPAA